MLETSSNPPRPPKTPPRRLQDAFIRPQDAPKHFQEALRTQTLTLTLILTLRLTPTLPLTLTLHANATRYRYTLPLHANADINVNAEANANAHANIFILVCASCLKMLLHPTLRIALGGSLHGRVGEGINPLPWYRGKLGFLFRSIPDSALHALRHKASADKS